MFILGLKEIYAVNVTRKLSTLFYVHTLSYLLIILAREITLRDFFFSFNHFVQWIVAYC